jgi:phosphatidylserine/phosphatidylglycerophosphate/cardiolipin synthase-like enzyme
VRDLLLRTDELIGEGLERGLRAHHRRRLAKLGWEQVFDVPPKGWAAGVPPPRPGSSVEVLIDGEDAFSAMTEAIQGARSHVHIAGWHALPDFVLRRDGPPTILRNLLEATARAADVRLLLWAGAPVPPPLTPSRRSVRASAQQFRSDGSIAVALDAKERLLHCHHEKIVVVDDDVAFVGGLDFTRLGGNRLDGRAHRERGAVGWHDVVTRLRGPVVGDVASHFSMRWTEVTGSFLPGCDAPAGSGAITAQIVRTIPERVYEAVPRGDFRILETYLRTLRSARRFIYLENQFLWSSEIVRILADKLRDPPSDDFRILLLLPAKPSTGSDDTLGQLAVLADADGGRNRFLACTLYASNGRAVSPVYVHAKVTVVDDRWLMVGSANLNNHSLFNDTELNVVVEDPDLARTTRQRLWAEHLECSLPEVRGEVAELYEEKWAPIAREQMERRERGLSLSHRLVRLPHVSRRSKRLLGPLQTLVVDG